MSAAAAFSIEGECSIYRAAELAHALRTWMDATPPEALLRLDLARVTEMDSAGLQLLLSLQRSLNEQGRRWQLSATSPSVQAVLEMAGLTPWALEAAATSASEYPE